MSQDQLPTITIDLNGIPSQAITKEGLIQRHVYEALSQRVNARLEWVKSHTNRPVANTRLPSGMGWVSFIDGTRGAGKSTFLHTALKLLEEDFKDELAVMDWIDPSRIEANEILLLVLLKALNDKVTSKLFVAEKCEAGRSDSEAWKKSFKSVAGALVLFQKDHHPLNEFDEDLFFEIGLEQAGHSAKLRDNLNNLFTAACKILQVKALLFAFDDADTSAHCAIDLIETIRKYLDTPRVMIVITGDLELYSILVRQNFRHELARGKREEWGSEGSAGGRAIQQVRMLDHLEEQYLLKLFPLRERHHLFPLWRLADDSGNRRTVANFAIGTGIAQGQELKQFVRNLIKKGFRLATRSDISLYTEYLLMQPVRSVLQVLSRIQEDENEAGNGQFGLAIQDLPLQNFYHYNIASEELAAEDFRVLVKAVFDVALHDGDPDTSAYLRPSSALPHNRGAMYGLSAAVAQKLRGKPSACISYLLRAPGMVKLAHDAANSNIRKLDEKILSHEFKRYMGVGKNDDALGWARLATVALVSEHAIAHNTRVVRYGIVGLNQDSSSGFTGYRKVFETHTDRFGAYPAAAFSLVNSSGTGPRTFASIYNVLGLMGRLLELTGTQGWEGLEEDQKKKSIRSALSGFYPNTNTISVPPWIAITSTDNEDELEVSPSSGNSDAAEEEKHDPLLNDEENPGSTSQSEEVFMSVWTKKLLDWLTAAQSLNNCIQPSSVFMGKVWPRLFFGLENISDALRPNHQNQSPRDFATLMELFALCVINAFLVEESTYHLTTDENEDRLKPIHMPNPRSSASGYLRRLRQLTKEDIAADRLPLTYIVATCPLVTGLISEKLARPRGVAWSFSINLHNGNPYDPDNFLDDSAWGDLAKIAIQGRKDRYTATAKLTASSNGTATAKVIPKAKSRGDKTTDTRLQSASSTSGESEDL